VWVVIQNPQLNKLTFCILNSNVHSTLLFPNTNTRRKFVLCEVTCVEKIEWGNNPELPFMATDLSMMWGRQDINMH